MQWAVEYSQRGLVSEGLQLCGASEHEYIKGGGLLLGKLGLREAAEYVNGEGLASCFVRTEAAIARGWRIRKMRGVAF